MKKFNLTKKYGRKNLILSIAAFILVMIFTVGVTYSWIEDIHQVVINLSNDEDADSTPLKIDYDINSNAVITKDNTSITIGHIDNEEDEDYVAATNGYFFESGDMHLSPCYSNGIDFYFPVTKTDGVTAGYYYRKGTLDDVNANYISATFKIESPYASVDFWFAEAPTISTNAALNNAARYAIIYNGDTYIYTNNGKYKTPSGVKDSSVLSSSSCRTISNYVRDDASNKAKRGEYNNSPNGNTLFTVPKTKNSDEAKTVSIKIWLEGGTDFSSISAADVSFKLASSWTKNRTINVVDEIENASNTSWLGASTIVTWYGNTGTMNSSNTASWSTGTGWGFGSDKGNCRFKPPSSGYYTFTFDTTNKRMLVTSGNTVSETSGSLSNAYYLLGTFNDWVTDGDSYMKVVGANSVAVALNLSSSETYQFKVKEMEDWTGNTGKVLSDNGINTVYVAKKTQKYTAVFNNSTSTLTITEGDTHSNTTVSSQTTFYFESDLTDWATDSTSKMNNATANTAEYVLDLQKGQCVEFKIKKIRKWIGDGADLYVALRNGVNEGWYGTDTVVDGVTHYQNYWQMEQTSIKEFSVSIPAVYNNEEIFFFRMKTGGWSGSNSGTHSLKNDTSDVSKYTDNNYTSIAYDVNYYNFWEHTLPDTFDTATFTIYSNYFGTWGTTVNKLYCINSLDWGNVYAYMWNSNLEDSKNKAFPGVAMSALAESSNQGKTVYVVYYSEEYDKVIFNNGSGGGYNQTPTFTMNTSKPYFDLSSGAWIKSSGKVPTTGSKIYVKGNWDGWKDETNNMVYNEDAGSDFYASIQLAQGEYSFKIRDEYVGHYGNNGGSMGNGAKWTLYTDAGNVGLVSNYKGIYYFHYNSNNHELEVHVP